MTALDRIPTNINYLSVSGFRFYIKKAPNVNFFVQQVQLPGMQLAPTKQPNPFVDIPIYGDHITYEDLSITFKVDEDLQNYLEIHNWIRAIGFPEQFSEFKTLWDTEQQFPSGGDGIHSDISLMFLSNLKNPNMEFVFQDAFPISLSGTPLEIVDNEVKYVSATVVFKYRMFDVITLP